MELTQKELEFWMSTIPKIGVVKIGKLLEFFGDEEEVFKSGKTALEASGCISQTEAEILVYSRNEEQIKREYEKMQRKEIRLISIHEKDYPEKLRVIAKAPYSLFVRGKMPEENRVSIAIVGARNCTSYGKELAKWFGRELSNAGIQVISGMAYGIDGCAHWGAFGGTTATYAVLGSGIDVCYPRENYELYRNLQQKGGILSEYAPGVKGKGFQFPMRNRIISGLSDGVVVVEARKKSGSLITADLALEQGKDVFAVPGRIGDPLSEGCVDLLKQGAELVTSPKDIIDNFHIQEISDGRKMEKQPIVFDTPEKIVYSVLSLEPKHIDQILHDSNMVMTQVISVLVKMELDGYVRQPIKNYYIRCY